jgi:hypothetical protein
MKNPRTKNAGNSENPKHFRLPEGNGVKGYPANRRLRVCARLWQGRFFSCPLDNDHLRAAIRYVERDLVRAGIVGRAEDYPWSSATAHCGMRLDRILSPLPELISPQAANWSSWLADPEDERLLKRIQHHTRTWRPFAMANGRPRKRDTAITPVQKVLCF